MDQHLAERAAKEARERARRIIRDQGFVAPEVMNAWLEEKIAHAILRAYENGFNQGKSALPDQ